MKANHIKGLGDYFAWLIKQYQALQQKNLQHYLYKIVDKEIHKKTGEEVLRIQVAGKNVFLTMPPREIAADDAMLRGFSPIDVRMITYLACKEHFQAKPAEPSLKRSLLYRIATMAFSRRQKQQILVIEQVGKAEMISTSIQSVSNSPEMLDGFSSRDAHRIGYVAGVESVLAEKTKTKN